MKHYDHVMIGFGKAAKTLAATFAKDKQSVALIEKSDKMYGGTCINIACIPSKALDYRAKHSPEVSDKAERYRQAVQEKMKSLAFFERRIMIS